MSRPKSTGEINGSAVIREGTRVILREITANLRNSPAAQSPRRKSGNEAASIKGEQQHDVKVRFIREFADAGASGREANTESSLSSASSFQSITSTLSSKCSSGICVDSSPANACDTSYISTDIPGLDDLISACENIRLTDRTFDLAKDQSLNLELDRNDLSFNKTFTSAIDRNSLDRTRQIFETNSPVNVPPDVIQDLNSTRIIDVNKETSSANAYFECSTVDIIEASRYHQANSELGSIDETFVLCVSNLAQVDPPIDGNAPDKLKVNLAKTDKTHENLEILVNNKHSNNLQAGHNTNNVANPELPLDDLTGNSTVTLESLSGNIGVDAAVQLKEIEDISTSGQNEVAELLPQSGLDVTLDFPSDLKQFGSTGPTGQSELAAKSTPSVLDVDLTSDLEGLETGGITGKNKLAENPVKSLLNVTGDFSDDNKEFKSTQVSEIAENPVQSTLNITDDIPRCFKKFADQPSDLEVYEQNQPKSPSHLVVNDVSSIESHECYKPLTPVLSELEDNSGCLNLPTLSSIGLRAPLVETDVPLSDKGVENVPSTEDIIPTVAVPSLSEKFVNIAANDISHGDSISTVQEPTFFNAQQLVEESTEFRDNLTAVKNEAPSVSAKNIDETLDPDFEISQNIERLIKPQAIEVCQFKNVGSINETIPPSAVPSLSEKFVDIAAIDIPHSNSILLIQEPTFLNAQKLAKETTKLEDNLLVVKTEPAISNVENTDKSVNPSFENAQNVEKLLEPSAIEVCEFKKPSLAVQSAASKIVSPEPPKKQDKKSETQSVDSVKIEKLVVPEIDKGLGLDSSTGSEDLNDTVTIQDISAGNIFAVAESDQYAEFLPQQQSTALTHEGPTVNSHKSGLIASGGSLTGDNSVSKQTSFSDVYTSFVPQQHSTGLTDFADKPVNKLERQPTPFVTAPSPPAETPFNGQNNKNPKPTLAVDDRCNFEKLEVAANAVANDIYNTSQEIEYDGNTRFVSATSELFHDPTSFDFLLSKTPRKNTLRDLRAESLYVKFDPLVSNTSMLPQGNIQNTSSSMNEERNGDNNTTISNIATPKRNPAIAAIDRLLFYSPMTTTTAPTTNTENIQKTNDSLEKVEPREETSAETINMAKELELVRSTVIQLEEQLEKLKIDYEEALEKQSSYQDKINQLQTQLAQEIKNKNQITVVVDEYEKSISRLVAEKERDRKNLDFEKAKLQEELAAAKSHLENSEAAFNDVHLKYERLKSVAAAYKSNEVALKQSAQKNVEIIKSLEIRNEQVKEHATARLEKANQDLDAMLKQHESEKVRLHAMVKKAELKSKSLAELVEQKTKENKELTVILDEVIARVGRNKSE